MDARKLVIFFLFTFTASADDKFIIYKNSNNHISIESKIISEKPEKSKLLFKINNNTIKYIIVPGIKNQKILYLDYDKKNNRIAVVYEAHLNSYDQNGKIIPTMTGGFRYVYLINLRKKDINSNGYQEMRLSSDIGSNGKPAKHAFLGSLSEGNLEARAYYWIYYRKNERELVGYDYVKIKDDKLFWGYHNLLPDPKGPYDDKPMPDMKDFVKALNSPDAFVRENMLSDNLGRHFPIEYVDVMISAYDKEKDPRNRDRLISIIMNNLTLYGKPDNLKRATTFAQTALKSETDSENIRKLTNSIYNIQTIFYDKKLE